MEKIPRFKLRGLGFGVTLGRVKGSVVVKVCVGLVLGLVGKHKMNDGTKSTVMESKRLSL